MTIERGMEKMDFKNETMSSITLSTLPYHTVLNRLLMSFDRKENE